LKAIEITNFYSCCRQREACLTAAEQRIKNAKGADRVTISQALKASKDSSAYKVASKHNQTEMEGKKINEVVAWR
jgi:hypothetical protein